MNILLRPKITYLKSALLSEHEVIWWHQYLPQVSKRPNLLSLQLDLELTRTVQMATDYSKNCAKGERRVKELQFQSEENQKNRDRIGELIDKMQQKIR